jgi:hypothetical protein
MASVHDVQRARRLIDEIEQAMKDGEAGQQMALHEEAKELLRAAGAQMLGELASRHTDTEEEEA